MISPVTIIVNLIYKVSEKIQNAKKSIIIFMGHNNLSFKFDNNVIDINFHVNCQVSKIQFLCQFFELKISQHAYFSVVGYL